MTQPPRKRSEQQPRADRVIDAVRRKFALYFKTAQPREWIRGVAALLQAQGHDRAHIDATVRNIGNWLDDGMLPSLARLIELADLLKCSLDELVGRKDPTPFTNHSWMISFLDHCTRLPCCVASTRNNARSSEEPRVDGALEAKRSRIWTASPAFFADTGYNEAALRELSMQQVIEQCFLRWIGATKKDGARFVACARAEYFGGFLASLGHQNVHFQPYPAIRGAGAREKALYAGLVPLPEEFGDAGCVHVMLYFFLGEPLGETFKEGLLAAE